MYENAEERNGLKHKKAREGLSEVLKGEERLVEEKHAYRNKAVRKLPMLLRLEEPSWNPERG